MDTIQHAGNVIGNPNSSLASRFARKPSGHTLNEVSQEFEGMFMAQMLKPIFDTVNVDANFGGGHGEEAMRGFLVQEYGKAMAKNSHFGIANAVKQHLILAQEKQHQSSNGAVAAPNNGAAHASGSAQ